MPREERPTSARRRRYPKGSPFALPGVRVPRFATVAFRFARVRLVVRLLAALASLSCPACREGATTPPKGPAAEPATVARPAASPPGASTAPVAASTAPAGQDFLSAPDRLTHLFEQLASLDDGHTPHDVVVLQYGDSHTASDYGVSVLRHTLQSRFGEGGRGFVPIGRPWKTYGQEGVRGGMTQEFQPVTVTSSSHAHGGPGDGSFGLLGVGLETSQPGARAWTEVTVHTSRVELAYLEQPLGGGFDVLVDGSSAGRVATRAAQPRSAYVAFDVTDAPHTIEVRTLGDGVVRVYGLTLDRAEAGVVVDTLGINGAQIATLLRFSPDHFAEQLRHASPDLVVLAYGTNEALEAKLADADYQDRLAELLGRVEHAAPGASCLLLGPPDLARRTGAQGDWKTWPRLVEIVAMQRRAAHAAGCAFYDQLAAMGGPGSMAAWASQPEPRAQSDRVHLTRSGYAQLATSLATSILHAYDEWRVERGLPVVVPKSSGVATR
jgi:lysophospholipase L1-like esterase